MPYPSRLVREGTAERLEECPQLLFAVPKPSLELRVVGVGNLEPQVARSAASRISRRIEASASSRSSCIVVLSFSRERGRVHWQNSYHHCTGYRVRDPPLRGNASFEFVEPRLRGGVARCTPVTAGQ